MSKFVSDADAVYDRQVNVKYLWSHREDPTSSQFVDENEAANKKTQSLSFFLFLLLQAEIRFGLVYKFLFLHI